MIRGGRGKDEKGRAKIKIEYGGWKMANKPS
jgi:hypothetical protein